MTTSDARSSTPATAVRVALLVTLLVRATGFCYPFLSYRAAELGYSPSIAGRILACFGLGWLLGQPTMGWATDRYGPRRALAAALCVGAVAFPAAASARSLPWLVVGVVVAGAVADAPRPVVSAVISAELAADADRVRANSWRHWATNVGAAVTGGVGGFAAGHIGLPALWRIEGAGCAVMAVTALVWLPSRGQSGAGWADLRLAAGDRRLWWLAGASLGGLIPIMAIFTALPMLMASDQLPPYDFGVVQVANMLVVLALTPVIGSRLSRTAVFRPLTAALAGSSVCLGAAMGATGLVHTTLGYTATIIAYTPGEVVLFVAAGDLVARIAPAQRQGAYAGLWGTTLAAAGVLAPLLTSWALTVGGPHLVGAAIGGSGLLGAAVCYPLARSLPRRGKHRKARHDGSPPPLPLTACKAS